MNTQLPADLEQFVQAKVRSGRFTSSRRGDHRRRPPAPPAGRSRGSPHPGRHPPGTGRHAGRPNPAPRRSVRRHPPRPESAPGVMKYRIELAATAKADIRRPDGSAKTDHPPSPIDGWTGSTRPSTPCKPALCDARSPPRATNSPTKSANCSTARRGKRTHKHRIIFTVREDAVYVLYVRHTARDELEP